MAGQQEQARLERFCRRVVRREVVVGVIGLGYVGLPLAMELVRAGFRVVGVDRDSDRVTRLRQGYANLSDVRTGPLRTAQQRERLFISDDYRSLALAEAVIICVPTPVTAWNEPDLSCVEEAVCQLGPVLNLGSLVVLESTTYPGTTEEVVGAALAASGFRVGEDVFLCYSPERVDPANPRYRTWNTPKILAGCTPDCHQAGLTLYRAFLDQVVPVSSTRTAEMVKLVENVFRSVNIALANEMAVLSAGLGIDVWEVITAASTKPFGFMPFYPGPGTGGHCIPVDPLYLQWKAQQVGLSSRLIEVASHINATMPDYVADQLDQLLQRQGKGLDGASVLLLGLAYKRDVADTRESPAVRLLHVLQERGCRVQYHDPLVPTYLTAGGQRLDSVPLTRALLGQMDGVVLTTDHSGLPYAWIAAHARLVLDTRNALAEVRLPSVHRLGVPWAAPAAGTEPAAPDRGPAAAPAAALAAAPALTGDQEPIGTKAGVGHAQHGD